MLRKVLAAIGVMSFTIPIMGLASHALALNITLSKAKPNTVTCELDVTNTAGIDPDSLHVTCKVGPPSEGQTTQPGLVLCLNPGIKKNAAPGIQLREVELVGSFEDESAVNQVNCNGETGECQKSVTASAKGAQLASLNVACPNRLWTASDFAPCLTTITVKATGTCNGESESVQTVQAEATYTCVLKNCQAVLKFNKNTQVLEGPDYTCTQVSSVPGAVCESSNYR